MQQLIDAQTGQPLNPDPVTCTQLTGLVYTVNQFLYQISNALTYIAANQTAPADLSPVVAAIVDVATQLQSYPPVWQACCTAISGQLANIAEAIQPTDVSGIVQQLQKLFNTIDVPQAVYDQLTKDGFLPPGYAQLFSPGQEGPGIVTTISTWFHQFWENYKKQVTTTAPPGIPAPVPVAGTNPEQALAKALSSFLSVNDSTVTPTVQALVTTITGFLKPPTGFRTSLGVIDVNPDKPVSAVVSVALTAGIASYLMSFVGLDSGEPLARLAEVIAGAVGFEELRDVQIGPLIRQGIATIAERQAKATFQQELPGTSAMTGWVAQGLMNETRAQALSLLNGTPDELWPIILKASYRGLNARQMLRLIETDLFSPKEIVDELTFSAMRPVSQARMLRAAPYLATASERSSLRSTLASAYVAGLLSDADLESQVLAAEQNTDLAGLVLSRSRLQKLIAETKALETEYTSLFIGGLIDDATYRGYLQALGLQPDMVSTIAGRAEARANVTLNRRAIAEAAREAKALQKAIDQAALKNFTAGNIDEAALSAALIASGLPPSQVASLVDLAVLRKAGSLRWIYGLQLLPSQATLLRQRVSDLTDQRKRLQITDVQYVGQLQALGLPAKWVNALQAQADALISPKSAAFPVPVQTG